MVPISDAIVDIFDSLITNWDIEADVLVWVGLATHIH